MNWHDCIHKHVASHRVGCGRIVMLNSPLLVMGVKGSEMGQRPRLRPTVHNWKQRNK